MRVRPDQRLQPVRHAPLGFRASPRRADLTLAKKVIPGWAADIAYEDGVARTIEWFRGHMGQTHERAPQLQG
mgnify:CR=1 FL=1